MLHESASFGTPVSFNTKHLQGDLLLQLKPKQAGRIGETGLDFVDNLLLRLGHQLGVEVDLSKLACIISEMDLLELEHVVLAEVLTPLGAAIRSSGLKMKRSLKELGACYLILETPEVQKSEAFYISAPGGEPPPEMKHFSNACRAFAVSSNIHVQVLACWTSDEIFKEKFASVWQALGNLIGEQLRKLA
jgi:hypothetical protein